MKMELPDDAEDTSNQLIGAMRAVRDLIAGQDTSTGGCLSGIGASDMGYLIDVLTQKAAHAHTATFGKPPPRAANS